LKLKGRDFCFLRLYKSRPPTKRARRAKTPTTAPAMTPVLFFLEAVSAPAVPDVEGSGLGESGDELLPSPLPSDGERGLVGRGDPSLPVVAPIKLPPLPPPLGRVTLSGEEVAVLRKRLALREKLKKQITHDEESSAVDAEPFVEEPPELLLLKALSARSLYFV
jgi:hypothetical protein